MKPIVWGGFVGGLLLAALFLVGGPGPTPTPTPAPPVAAAPAPVPKPDAPPRPPVPVFSAGFIDDSGYDLAVGYTPAIRDRSSIAEVAAAYRERTPRGRVDLKARLEALEATSPRPPDFDQRRAMLQTFAALLEMYEGNFRDALPWLDRALADNPGLDPAFRTNLGVLRGIAELRRGEVENCVACVGPSSCIFPIAPEARHQQPEGSRAAIRWFTEYLEQRPEDLGVRWLLNVAAMTLGAYPDGVSEAYRIPAGPAEASDAVGRFVNVAAEAGLNARGPNMLGGSLFDDFTGDGLPDIVVTSGDWDLGASLFVNRGDGTFEDQGTVAGLDDQVLAVNAAQGDFDNDGRLDLIALRGGWEAPARLSLLRNTGGAFEDVTLAAGLGEPITSQSAAWGDYDNDGRLDLFVAGEFRDRPFDPRNRCRLYRNNGDGTFTNVAAAAGVENERWAKGAAWGDYDDDGHIDLYVSNMNGPNRLYRNGGDGTFVDVAPALGLTDPIRSFSCWFWDYDDDGRLDLFVAGFGAYLSDIIADRLGQPTDAERPRLYRNVGGGKFRDLTEQAGLDHVYLPMGSNFADVDNDGHLDLYLATGRPAYSNLYPNILLRNVEGRRFRDVTAASGTGHLQKGHGVSFADHDEDGDLDLFVQIGGQTPGDKSHNALFLNPGNDHHWIRLKLIGTKANRSAIGAKLKLDLTDATGKRRSIHRVVGGGSSFGGNALAPTIGLGGATAIEALTITWPGSGTVQTLRDLAADQAIAITEGDDAIQVIPARP